MRNSYKKPLQSHFFDTPKKLEQVQFWPEIINI